MDFFSVPLYLFGLLLLFLGPIGYYFFISLPLFIAISLYWWLRKKIKSVWQPVLSAVISGALALMVSYYLWANFDGYSPIIYPVTITFFQLALVVIYEYANPRIKTKRNKKIAAVIEVFGISIVMCWALWELRFVW